MFANKDEKIKMFLKGRSHSKMNRTKEEMSQGGKTESKDESLEEIRKLGLDPNQYMKLTDFQHLDRRSDMYVGSMDTPEEGLNQFIFDADQEAKGGKNQRTAVKVSRERVMCPVALLNIYEEITQNAIDKSIEDPTTKTIKVEVHEDLEKDEIEVTVWNDGEGIPCYVHPKTGLHVPTMLFGVPKTSDKYDDSKERVSGGRNGWGAKATFFFSKEAKVETYSTQMGKVFKQTFFTTTNEDGDRTIGWKKPSIREVKLKSDRKKDPVGYTKVSFKPDLGRFGLTSLPLNLGKVLRSKVWDIAACTHKGISVYLDGKKLPVDSFPHYVSLFSEEALSTIPVDTIEGKDGRTVWSVGVLPRGEATPESWDIGFVNGLRCCKGRHVEYARDKLGEVFGKKLKTTFKGSKTRDYCHIFVAISIVRPKFDHQTKTELTSLQKDFGFKWEPSARFVSALQRCGVFDKAKEDMERVKDAKVLEDANKDAKTTRNRLMGRSIVAIDKLRDACNAGKRKANCTLIVAEGLSAILSVEPGLEVLGSENYGLLPLRGVVINASQNSLEDVLDNEEIKIIVQTLGLRFGCDYSDPKDYASLRYKHIWMMMDQDTDGSHICGLFYNFLRTYFKGLLHNHPDFVYRFSTPLIRAAPKPKFKKRFDLVEFFAHADFVRWMADNEEESKCYDIIYLKGLATSDQEDMRRYMESFRDHLVRFEHRGDASDAALDVFFSDEKVHKDGRKELLKTYDPTVSFSYAQKNADVADFLHKDMIHFSMDSLVRAMACAVDGLKPSQRKLLYTGFAKKISSRTKVAQLAATASAFSNYHHGEKSMEDTLTKMAQEHTGSNNFNFFFPAGAFGSRSKPRDEHGQSRYIFTYVNPVTRFLYPFEDTAVTRRKVEEEELVEPFSYVPIVPTILLNGAKSIGTGWSSDILAFNPVEVIDVQEAYVRDQGKEDEGTTWIDKAEELKPWYFMYEGSIEPEKTKDGSMKAYISRGRFTVKVDEKCVAIHITELPIMTWTDDFLLKVKEAHMYEDKKKDDKDSKRRKTKEPKKPKAPKVKFIIDENNRSTNCKVDITFFCDPEKINKFLASSDGGLSDGYSHPKLVKALSMEKRIGATNMHAMDVETTRDGAQRYILRKFNKTSEFFKVHGVHRLALYEERKAFQLSKWSRKLLRLKAQWRFVNEMLDEKIDIKRKKREDAFNILKDAKFPSDVRVKEPAPPSDKDLVVKKVHETGDDECDENESKDEDSKISSRTFHYLLDLSFTFVCEERLQKLKKEINDLKAKMKAYEETSVWDLWLNDLEVLKRETIKFMDEKETRCLSDAQKGAKKRAGSKGKGGTKRKK